MGMLFENLLADVTAIGVLLVSTLYLYMQYKFTYWKRKGVQSPAPSFPFGHFGPVFRQQKATAVVMQDLYNETTEPVSGIYLVHRPALLIKDPEIVKSILVRNFSKFQDRGLFADEQRDPLSAHLFSIGGQKWKNMRAKMTPAFTSGKLKAMFETNTRCSEQLVKYVSKNYADRNENINIVDILSRFTTDIIGSVAFGIDVNSIENPEAPLRKFGRRLMEPSFRNAFINVLFLFLPQLLNILRLKILSHEIESFLISVVKQTIEYREKNNVNTPDFMQLLIQLRNFGRVNEDGDWTINSDGTKKMTIEEVAAQTFVYFVAGFETSSATMTFCLHELCVNPEIQKRAQQDVNQALAKHGGKISYDCLNDMPYLDNVISETLRKYPPLAILNRECNETFTIEEINLTIDRGTPIIVSLLGLQRDAKHFPDPLKFDPDRFMEVNRQTRHPSTFIPFGEGGRACIGLRQGKMQTKVGLAALLSRFTFERCPKTNDPLIFHPTKFTLSDPRGVWMEIKNRNKIVAQ